MLKITIRIFRVIRVFRGLKAISMNSKILYADESYLIMKACFEVYKRMGCGFLEPVYQECLQIELNLLSVPFKSQVELPIIYRDQKTTHMYKADLICFNKIIVELKAVSLLIDEHRAQVLNYLNATGLQLGLLINFGHHPKLEYERFILTKSSTV